MTVTAPDALSGIPSHYDSQFVTVNAAATANIIREGKTEQLENVIQGGALQGMQSIDMTLRRMLDEKLITGEEAHLRARNKKAFEQYREQKPAPHQPNSSSTQSFK